MEPAVYKQNIVRMNKVARRLQEAYEQLGPVFPLDPAGFDPDTLDPQTSLLLDGFRARFSDLQDVLGRTLFKSVATMDEDEQPGRELTTRERIALMERRGLVDAGVWKDIREVRNGFAHEYPDQKAEKAANLNAAWAYVPTLLQVASAIADYARIRHGLDLGED